MLPKELAAAAAAKQARCGWCPSCALAMQTKQRKTALLEADVPEGEWGSYPLFVGAGAQRITKAEVAEENERIASRQGLPLTEANKRRCCGGHFFRHRSSLCLSWRRH